MEYGNSALAEFDTMFDLDIGIMRLVRDKYSNAKYIKPWVTNGSDEFFRCLSLSRRETNIMETLLTKENVGSANQLLLELYDKHFEEIFKLSPSTSIFGLVKLYAQASGIAHVGVICKNPIEEQYIKSLQLKMDIVTDTIQPNPVGYDAIFIHNIENIPNYNSKNNLKGYTLYVSNYMFNYVVAENGTNILKVDKLVDIAVANNIFTVDPFVGVKLPASGITNDSKLEGDNQ